MDESNNKYNSADNLKNDRIELDDYKKDLRLDLDSRIKNVIGNYFSLNKINNDYVRMSNNPTNSQDLSGTKGQVVDIDVQSS